MRTGVLLALVVFVALWFIACFTGDAERNKRHGFVFAYAFTFGAFALLVTPFVSPKTPDNDAARPVRPAEGVLQLVRGCVSKDVSGNDVVSAVTKCPTWAYPAADSGASAPPGDAGASAPAGAAVREVGRQFAWLVSIGGVTIRKYEPQLPNGEFKPLDSYVEVHGGIAVPLFVVVLAFIGGAVSLSRRIPEYQRRSEPGYAPRPDEPPLKAYEARESVVFQIMQLVSAPFLAIATWYIVSPTTIAAAAGLAFGTGFASEPLLLMIRGMVEGIRPAGSKPEKPTCLPVRGTVMDADKRDRKSVV